MKRPMVIIVEGVDNSGKTTLIGEIIKMLGFYQVIKMTRPVQSEIYDNSLEIFQRESYSALFHMAKLCLRNNVPIIFDRFHLGEYVYSPLYRSYDGSYVFEMEKAMLRHLTNAERARVLPIHLRVEALDIMKDDGLSFNHSRTMEEQSMFDSARKISALPWKVMNVHRKVAGKHEWVPARETLLAALDSE